MRHTFVMLVAGLLSAVTVFPQNQTTKPPEQVIRISTELVQLDAVVTNKDGHVIPNLSKDDFEVFENGKRQSISFFEYVNAKVTGPAGGEAVQPSPQGISESDLRRVFAFVVDDLTIRPDDLVFIRHMLRNFVDEQMQPADLVGIFRIVGGKGLLQQFTWDKQLLRKAIASLGPSSHPFALFQHQADGRMQGRPAPLEEGTAQGGGAPGGGDADGLLDTTDITSPTEDTNQLLRAVMSLGTASFVIDSMKPLPGRKSMVLISGGMPIFSPQTGVADNITIFMNELTDRATRSGVAINTLDIRGLGAQSAVASFADTPGRSGLVSSAGGLSSGSARSRRSGGETISGGGTSNGGDDTSFGRGPDSQQFGFMNPVDTTFAQMGLRALSLATGGISVLNKNDFDEGLKKIVDANEGYYVLAYTPIDGKFNGKFRKLEVKVKRDGMKVYSRRGYFAREDKPEAPPETRRDQLLAAIKSPLAKREVTMDAMLLYKSAEANNGAISILMSINPAKLNFEPSADRKEASFDVAGFVFDELGKLRGGFSETVSGALDEKGYQQALANGIPYSANTSLPPGAYQIRLAVRDNKTNAIGTLTRYLEVPDLNKGRLAASSLLLGGVTAGDMSAKEPVPITGNRQISKKQDLRYAVMIYNAKLKDDKPRVRTQLIVSQNGKKIYEEPEELLQTSAKPAQLIKVGQLGLSGVLPGRYMLTVLITDELADKKSQGITRSMDFVVVK